MGSVVELRNWVANRLGLLADSAEVDHVLRVVRRQLDHPMYTRDPLMARAWDAFLGGLDLRHILLVRHFESTGGSPGDPS